MKIKKKFKTCDRLDTVSWKIIVHQLSKITYYWVNNIITVSSSLLRWRSFTCAQTAQDSRQLVETCQLETLEARCRWNSEVIVMTSARWGRMQTGRCLDIHPNLLAKTGDDPLFLGCSEDVLSIMDAKCSGRPACDVRIIDELNDVQPCYPDLTRYLQYSYKCVKGVCWLSNVL